MQSAPGKSLGQRLQGRHKCAATSRRPLRTLAAAKQGTDAPGDIKNARLARILRQYDAADQQAELDAYVSQRNQRLGDAEEGASRVLRASAGRRAELGPKEQAELDLHMPRRGDGIREPNYGLHGDGEEQWWALHVRPGREKQVCEGLERVVAAMEPLPPAAEGGEERPRTFSAWAPKKQIKAWNPKTGKMGNKVLRFPQKYTELAAGQGSGWGYVFIRAVLDNDLYNAVQYNPSVINWAHASTFTDWDAGDRERAVHRFPKPCPTELLDEAKDWELDDSPAEEAAVRAAIEAAQPKPDPATLARWEEEERQAEAEEAAAREEWARGRGRGRRDDRDGERGGWRERGPRFERRVDGEGRRGRRFGEPGSGGEEGASWFEGGGSGESEPERGGRGSYRERQGAGLYSARQEGGFERRQGGFERRDGGFERRQGGFERRDGGFERRQGGFERRDGGFERRQGGFERRDGGFERRQRGERFGGDRDGRRGRDRGGWAEGGDERLRQAPRDGDRDASGAGWYGGGAAAEPDSAWGAAAAGQTPSEDGFAGWFDSAAAALGDAEPAARGGWSWEPPPQQQAGSDGGAAAGQAGAAAREGPAAGSPPAVDLGDVWGQQQASGDLGWLDAPAGGADAFGFPTAAPRQQEQRGRRDDRGERRPRFDGGERRPRLEGGERSQRGERRGRFDRGERNERGERSGGGDWFGGGDRDRSAQGVSGGGADLSWWDSDSPSDEVGFAGMYKGPADWEGGAQSEEPAAGRGGGRGRGRGSDAGGEGATEGATAAVAAAAFQPGQAVAVTSGNFRDFEGKVVAAEGGKVTAELDIFGKRTRVDLSPADLAPAGGDGSSD